MSWVSQAAYSSAVRLASVRRRHCATMRSPSNTTNLELVLPTSMASSMPSSSGRAAQQLTRHDPARTGRRLQQQGALAVHAAEAAAHQLLTQPHIHLGAERPGLA